MKSEDLFALIGEVDEKKVAEANVSIVNEGKPEETKVGIAADKNVLNEKVRKKKGVFHMKKKCQKWFKIGVAAACVMAVIGAAWFLGENREKLGAEIELSEASSDGVSVYYIENPTIPMAEYDLVWLSENDLFKLNEWNDVIFRGTVERIDNIVCEFGGDKEYRGLVEISVEKVYRGELKSDAKISVLTPYAINVGVWIEDSETVSAMKKGMEGIFVAMKYDEDSIWQQNGETLMLMDIAEYGFADGSRWMFLDAGNKILYFRDAYESLDAKTLDDVEEYVLEMIEKVK